MSQALINTDGSGMPNKPFCIAKFTSNVALSGLPAHMSLQMLFKGSWSSYFMHNQGMNTISSVIYSKVRNSITSLIALLIYLDDMDVAPSVRAWARHKKIPLYAAGTNRHHSGMPVEDFIEVRRHTNAVETAHHKAQSLGIRLSLLKAFKK